MSVSSTASRFRRHWFRRVGRVLVLVTQLVALVAPLAEAHEERPLSAHVEAPRSVPHPGHHADNCPACMLLSVHGCPVERPHLELCESERCVVAPERAADITRSTRSVSNSSRAPPSLS